MNIFLPKFLQRKAKNDTHIKCVGTRDQVILSTDEDSLIVQPSISDAEDNSDDYTDNVCSKDSSFISGPRFRIYPECCSKHLIDSSYKNFKYPTHDEMMCSRLELYFKKYPGRPLKACSEVKFVKERKFEKEEVVQVRNVVNKESLIPIKCSSPDEALKCNRGRSRVNCDIIKSTLDQRIEKRSTFEIRRHITESKASQLKESDFCIGINLSRQPSNTTTRSSQEIFYTANSSIISTRVNSNEDFDVSIKSKKNSKSISNSYCTTYNYSSSKSDCEEIAKLNMELSPNSQSHDNFDSTKNSLNWHTTMGCDNASTITKSKPIKSPTENIESDNVTSLTNENTANINPTTDQFTHVSVLSDKEHNLSFPSTDVTKVSPFKINGFYDILYCKELMNRRFEKLFSLLRISPSEESQNDYNRSVKSVSQYASKLPRRIYKRLSSSVITDLGTLDRFTYLSSLDESESCIN